jgi:hypothetical protein
MLFNSNTTNLGVSTIPMAEGYDCSYGAALALVESARNDMSMFKAMLEADWNEISIYKESTGVVREGEITSLQEAVGGGIFKKIADLFRKLAAKIKAIFHTFMSKINGLFMKDKELVKKYSKELLTKKNINKLEVKWRKVKSSAHNSVEFDLMADTQDFDENEAETKWQEEEYDRVKTYLIADLANVTDSVSEYKKEHIDSILDDEDTLELQEIGGIRYVCSFLSDYGSKLRKMESNIRKNTNKIEALVKTYDKKANTTAKAAVAADAGEEAKKADKDVESARKQYEMAQAYQTAKLALMDANVEIATIEYKQNKAAFMKAIAASEKKLEENAVYAQAVAEAAEQEVEDVIGTALSSEEISKICTASRNVKDGDVSDCPNTLTYGPDCYTANPSYTPSSGTIDSDINSKSESAYFGQMLY